MRLLGVLAADALAVCIAAAHHAHGNALYEAVYLAYLFATGGCLEDYLLVPGTMCTDA